MPAGTLVPGRFNLARLVKRKTPSRKKKQITETLISQLKECYLGSSATTCQTPEDEFIRWDDSGMTGACTIQKEACALIKSFAKPKKMLCIGNWNVRTMYGVGKTAQVVKEMQTYNLDTLGISGCWWSGSGRLKTWQVKLVCIREEMTTYTKVTLHLWWSNKQLVAQRAGCQLVIESWLHNSQRFIKNWATGWIMRSYMYDDCDSRLSKWKLLSLFDRRFIRDLHFCSM